RQLQRILTAQGLSLKISTKVTAAKAENNGVALTLEPAKGGDAETLEAEVVLVAIGRRPYTEDLGLDTMGVAVDNRGFVQIDDHFRTNVPGIYAIGDVVLGPMLAYKAEEEGVAVAEIIAGKP